jgi:DNA-binding transcriptional LysR family regulator
VFIEVAERASLTDAASALDMSRPMVARYVQSLEQWLGVRLLHRTTRRVSLTDAGDEAIQRCKQVLEMTSDIQAASGVRRIEPRGKLRIAASGSFAQAYLAGAFVEFIERYPQVQIEVIAGERTVNLVEERIDLAVRIGRRLDDGLIARPLGTCRSVICASPAYLAAHGTPQTPEQLKSHRNITHAYVGRSELVLLRKNERVRLRVSSALQSNETAVTRQAALEGGGIAVLPTYFVSGCLTSGELVRVLPDYEPEALGIHAAYLSRAHQPILLRLMLDFLSQRLSGSVAPWDRVNAAGARVPKRSRARHRRS